MHELFWSIAEDHFNRLLHEQLGRPKNVTFEMSNRRARNADDLDDDGDDELMQVRDGVALINISGPMTKNYSFFERYFGVRFTANMPALEKRIRSAAADPEIKGIVVRIDSPGGTVAGSSDLSDAIFAARQNKTVIAYVSDLAASGGYRAASQAHRIYGDSDATVGSIGTYIVVPDYSQMAEQDGVKVHVIKAGEFKGAGTPGTAVTEAQIAEWQRTVNELNAVFLKEVARGRGISVEQVRELADGRVHVGQNAVKLGLLDGIKTLEQAIDEARRPQSSTAGRGGDTAARQDAALLTSDEPDAPANRTASNTTQGVSLMNPTLRSYLLSVGLKQDATDAGAISYWNQLAGEQKAIADALASPKQETKKPEPKASTETVDPPLDAKTIAANERKRIDSIRGLSTSLNLGDAFATEMINGGFELADVREKALEKVEQRSKPIDVQIGSDLNRDTLGEAMADAIMARRGAAIPVIDDGLPVYESQQAADGKFLQKLKTRKIHDRARQFRGMSLSEMAKAYLGAFGIPTSGLSRNQICQMVFNRQLMMQQGAMIPLSQFGGGPIGHSTSDFPAILQNIATKSLLTGYAEAPLTWPIWCARGTAPDFKTISRTQLSEFPNLEAVLESGEIQYVTFGDAKETFALATYAKGFSLAWQALINDDLDAFMRIPLNMGAAARSKEEELVYSGILNANPNMRDSQPLFDFAAHANEAQTTGAPSIALLNDGYAMMMTQTGHTGDRPMNIPPRFIIGPAALRGTILELLTSQVKPGSGEGHTANVWQGQLVPVISAFLDAGSDEGWYLAASPNEAPTIEVCFLEDEPAPVVEEADAFNVLGRSYRVRHSVAAKALDWRGLVYNDGSSGG